MKSISQILLLVALLTFTSLPFLASAHGGEDDSPVEITETQPANMEQRLAVMFAVFGLLVGTGYLFFRKKN